MNLKNLYNNKNNIYLIIIFLFIMHQNDSFGKLFIISKSNITERLTKSYGYCENTGYGFINDVHKENPINENIEIFHANSSFTFNNSIWFKHKINTNLNKDRVILLNNKNNIKYIDNGIVSLNFKEKEYGTYKILKKVDNCFYLKKYD